MTSEQFCYWLQGRVEMQPENPPSAAEWKMIGEHLGLVFKKVTPTLAPNAPYHPSAQPLRPIGVAGGVAPTYC